MLFFYEIIKILKRKFGTFDSYFDGILNIINFKILLLGNYTNIVFQAKTDIPMLEMLFLISNLVLQANLQNGIVWMIGLQ